MDPYATHIAPLTIAALNTPGDILELGCGDYSTPILSAIAKHRGDRLLVQASDPAWASRYKDIAEVEIVNWVTWEPPIGNWGLVFLDSEQLTGDRIMQLPRLRSICKVVVIHDANICMNHSHYNEMVAGYSKKTYYTKHVPWTAVFEV